MHAFGDEAMSGGKVAEEHNHVGAEIVGLLHDRLDALDLHPRLAGVQIGNSSNRDVKVVGPARKLEVVARDARTPKGLDRERISGRRSTDDAERSKPLQETTPRDHAIEFGEDRMFM